jgi:hypothetical protein
VRAEGWYLDPYGLHEQRWFSDGTPTILVRDAGVEARDEPPPYPPPEPLVPVELTDSGADDLIRADELQRVEPVKGIRASSPLGGIAGVYASLRARERHFRRR